MLRCALEDKGMIAPVTVVVFALAVGACSSQSGTSSTSGGGLLDCAYLTSVNNCWKSTTAAAARCVPSPTEQGTMSADGKTCTYASGPVITFDNPVTSSGSSGPWSFTLTTGGKTCVRLTQPSSHSQTLTTSLGTLSVALVGAQGDLSLTCPDGTTYSGPQSSLSGCEKALPVVGIGTGGSSAADAGETWLTTFSLENTGASEVIVFRCGN
jgi:hypothetical protein